MQKTITDSMIKRGQLSLGLSGIEKNYTEGITWSKRLTALLAPNAMRQFGIFYLRGSGLPIDASEAFSSH